MSPEMRRAQSAPGAPPHMQFYPGPLAPQGQGVGLPVAPPPTGPNVYPAVSQLEQQQRAMAAMYQPPPPSLLQLQQAGKPVAYDGVGGPYGQPYAQQATPQPQLQQQQQMMPQQQQQMMMQAPPPAVPPLQEFQYGRGESFSLHVSSAHVQTRTRTWRLTGTSTALPYNPCLSPLQIPPRSPSTAP